MLLALVASIARAECVKIPPKEWLKFPDTELTFSGNVAEVTKAGELAVRATFEVERVWKGQVSRWFDVYTSPPASAETPYDEKDHSYVVIATRLLNKEARTNAGFGNSDAVVFTGANCSRLYSVDEFVRAVGRGKPPNKNSEQQTPADSLQVRPFFTRPLIPERGVRVRGGWWVVEGTDSM